MKARFRRWDDLGDIYDQRCQIGEYDDMLSYQENKNQIDQPCSSIADPLKIDNCDDVSKSLARSSLRQYAITVLENPPSLRKRWHQPFSILATNILLLTIITYFRNPERRVLTRNIL